MHAEIPWMDAGEKRGARREAKRVLTDAVAIGHGPLGEPGQIGRNGIRITKGFDPGIEIIDNDE
jgi:hypothetical protein